MILSILKPIGIILEVLMVFNLMIIVHELGHFLAARWRGLVIEKFGIWFGKPIWKKKINGVEYSLGSIPAGGFVALPQLAPMEVMEGKVETPREALPPITVTDKIIVAFTGPLFSFLLAVVFALIVWQFGPPMSEAENTTVVGMVQEKSPAAAAGMKVGDDIQTVDGHRVTRFQGMSPDSIMWSVVRSEGDTVPIAVKREADGQLKEITLSVAPRIAEKAHWWNRKNLRSIGILPSTSSIVAAVTPHSSAERAGLRKGDIITAIDGQKLFSPGDIDEYANDHPKRPYEITVQRGGAEMKIPFDPEGVRVGLVDSESPASAAGLQPDDVILAVDDQPVKSSAQLIDYIGTHAGIPVMLHVHRAEKPGFTARLLARLGIETEPSEKTAGKTGGPNVDVKVIPQVPISAPAEASKRAKMGVGLEGGGDGLAFEAMGKSKLVHPRPGEQIHLSIMAIVNTLDAVFSRKSSVSVQHMGGPVMMMNAYYHMLSSPEGMRMALWFSVILNVNLALINLLPIPVLDGGHITLAIIEGVRRKPMNVRVLEYVQTTCALVIIGFMIFIMFFDVQDLGIVEDGKKTGMHFQKGVSETAK